MMKKFLDEDLPINELKAIFKKLKRRDDAKCIVMLAIGVILLIATAVLIVVKVKSKKCCCDNYDELDEEFDENGCRYTGDEDFEN